MFPSPMRIPIRQLTASSTTETPSTAAPSEMPSVWERPSLRTSHGAMPMPDCANTTMPTA